MSFRIAATAAAAPFGELGRHYVTLIEKAAPHAPLAILREVLASGQEYGPELVAGVLESLVQHKPVKRFVRPGRVLAALLFARCEVAELDTALPKASVKRSVVLREAAHAHLSR